MNNITQEIEILTKQRDEAVKLNQEKFAQLLETEDEKKKEIKSIQKHLETEQEKVKNLEDKFKILNQQFNIKENELKASEQKINDLNKEITNKSTEIKIITDQKKELEDQKGTLEKELKGLEQTKQNYENNLIKGEKEIIERDEILKNEKKIATIIAAITGSGNTGTELKNTIFTKIGYTGNQNLRDAISYFTPEQKEKFDALISNLDINKNKPQGHLSKTTDAKRLISIINQTAITKKKKEYTNEELLENAKKRLNTPLKKQGPTEESKMSPPLSRKTNEPPIITTTTTTTSQPPTKPKPYVPPSERGRQPPSQPPPSQYEDDLDDLLDEEILGEEKQKPPKRSSSKEPSKKSTSKSSKEIEEIYEEHIRKSRKTEKEIEKTLKNIESKGPKGPPKGKDSKSKGGLWDYQIESMMKGVPNFQGCIAADEVEKLPPNKNMSFIMNLSPTNKSGSHWVACHMDTDNDREIDYYDSFGEEPSIDFLKQMKTLVNKIKPATYLKFKTNKIVDQRANSDTCGWHCMRFILDREHGVPFKETTGYSNVKQGEEKVKKLKEKFGFI